MSKKDTGVAGKAVTYSIPNPAGRVKIETFIPWTLIKRGVKKRVITPLDAADQFQTEAAAYRQARKVAQDRTLLKTLGLAHHWQRLLDEGCFQTLSEIAAVEQIELRGKPAGSFGSRSSRPTSSKAAWLVRTMCRCWRS